MISLGTSGVYFAAADGFHMNADSAVHSFCHALPNSWHLMSVTLSAASCLQWFADNIARKSVVELLDNMQKLSLIKQRHVYFYLTSLVNERPTTTHMHREAFWHNR
ncbi:FGGY-family carbohydrate kinase [Psychrosphaera sp. G1-22]|uniref:FGGY-family carbohydrate kinase n=1 Tax=Psychrosphaera algicola TaxID=3023714 RepID=A0ABT5F9F9_9GAMM|nr:FGGY-family carbohydrate kinase [Psychrosphaera sp. G1-22]MDC2888164.1 FGGY-family carbohydrate kinase [Psychrosphaera sp. G1-22]